MRERSRDEESWVMGEEISEFSGLSTWTQTAEGARRVYNGAATPLFFCLASTISDLVFVT